jgi:hypothetical protein
MFDADIHLRPLPNFILDIYTVFEPLLCCLKGMRVHPHTILLAKLGHIFRILGHLWSGNNAIVSWLRL